MSPTSSHGFILDRNHRRAQMPATKSSSTAKKANSVHKNTSPDSNTGMLFKRDPWIFSSEQLVYARTMLLRNAPHFKLSSKRKVQVTRTINALHRRIDGDKKILEHLSVPRTEEESKAVMAPGDAKRVRILRKVLVRHRDGREGGFLKKDKKSKKDPVTKQVLLGGPIVGGEEGMRFIVKGGTRRMSKLSMCVNASSFEGEMEDKDRLVECI